MIFAREKKPITMDTGAYEVRILEPAAELRIYIQCWTIHHQLTSLIFSRRSVMTLPSFGDVRQGKSKSHTRGCDVSLFGTPWGFPLLSLDSVSLL